MCMSKIYMEEQSAVHDDATHVKFTNNDDDVDPMRTEESNQITHEQIAEKSEEEFPYIDEALISSLNHPDDDDFQSEEPIGYSNHHILLQIYLKGSYKTVSEIESGELGTSSKKEINDIIVNPTKRLDITFSISSISEIDPVTETFHCKVRIFAFWRVDLHEIGMEDVAQRARRSGHFCHMKREEVEKFAEASMVPVFHAMNCTKMDDSDIPDVRVYGGEKGETAVLWNRGYDLSCKAHFDFREFPFDHQELVVQWRLNDLRQWDLFNMTVSTVQFHKQALQHSEWVFHEPLVNRTQPLTAASDIRIQMRRHPGYYILNIVLLLSGLVTLTLLVFALDVTDVGTRLLGVFTIILNAVAFKLFYTTLLPKVSYNTVLDHYIFENFALLGLMALFCVVPFFFAHDAEYADRLNLAMLALSALLVAVNLSKFFLKALYLRASSRASNKHTREVQLREDKAWYSFRYSQPHYLPAI